MAVLILWRWRSLTSVATVEVAYLLRVWSVVCHTVMTLYALSLRERQCTSREICEPLLSLNTVIFDLAVSLRGVIQE